MKILKTLSIFVIFCVCVCNLTAQIIENVSYTPSKQGNYGTVTTRSLATFAGLVSVGGNQGEVIGVGDKLTLDTYGYNNSTLNAGRNIFTSVTKAPTGNTNVYGNLNTTNNANINTLNAANAIIYGGTTNFANSEVALNNSGILEISDVKMKNPKCDIKWKKLPAYKASADYGHTKTPTATDYWFAYCDSDTNVVPNNWNASITTVNALATCLAHTGNCNTDESDDTHHKRYFTCSDIAVYQCTSDYSTRNEFNLYTPITSNKIWTCDVCENDPVNNPTGCKITTLGTCGGAIRRYKATVNANGSCSYSYGGMTGEIVPTPVDVHIGDTYGCSTENANNTLAAYCGIQNERLGTDSTKYYTFAQDAYYKMTSNSTCPHSNTELALCNELGNYSYDDWSTVLTAYHNHTYSTEDLCTLIETGHGSEMESFSCVINVPDPNSFTYYKSTYSVNKTEYRTKCKRGHCYSSANYTFESLDYEPGYYCKQKESSPTAFNQVSFPDGYVSAKSIGYPNSYWSGLNLPGEKGKAGLGCTKTDGNFTGYTYRTHYLNKKMKDTSVLNCSK